MMLVYNNDYCWISAYSEDAGICADQGERRRREGNHAGACTHWKEARPPCKIQVAPTLDFYVNQHIQGDQEILIRKQHSENLGKYQIGIARRRFFLSLEEGGKRGGQFPSRMKFYARPWKLRLTIGRHHKNDFQN